MKRKERQLFPTSTAKPPERTSVANHYELEQEVVSSAHDVVHPDIIFSWRVGTAGKIDPTGNPNQIKGTTEQGYLDAVGSAIA